MSKEELITKLLRNPAGFSETDLDELLRSDNPDEKITPSELLHVTMRIFDLNERNIYNGSRAEEGILGKLNRRSRRIRNRRYMRKINKGFRAEPGNKIILAEGDSWFEFPVFVRDIIDWLQKRKDYAVYSLAYGGDWLANILYQGEYVEGLPVHTPDVFLISGGGNDLVSKNRLTTMMINPLKDPVTEPSKDYIESVRLKISNEEEVQRILRGKCYQTREFKSLINVIRLQYELMFSNIFTKYPDLKIITHGYDYPIPDRNIHIGFNLLHWHQPLMNRLTCNGKWLYQSFMLKGITDPELQQCILRTMIFDFNEMLIRIAQKTGYKNLFHIDCRGICKRKDDWYDELHPQSMIFKRIAQKYQECIDGLAKDKVLRVSG
ncbi:MAG: SGNH/GDSL hydrolase family protein [Bacteroidales bacterium]|nr:SGNH/GDSL hydrolase family protein [Bacteroidales bacterium]